jgi:hypothetical protein
MTFATDHSDDHTLSVPGIRMLQNVLFDGGTSLACLTIDLGRAFPLARVFDAGSMAFFTWLVVY